MSGKLQLAYDADALDPDIIEVPETEFSGGGGGGGGDGPTQLTCPSCACEYFHAFDDGAIECAACHEGILLET